MTPKVVFSYFQMDLQISPESFAGLCLNLRKVDGDISRNPWAVPDVSEFLK